MGLTIEKVLDAGKEISTDDTFPTIWMTLVVTMFLTEKCAEQKNSWELVVAKAQRWLQMSVDSFCLGDQDEKAKGFIIQTIPVKQDERRSCIQGPKLSPETHRSYAACHCDSKIRCVGGCAFDENILIRVCGGVIKIGGYFLEGLVILIFVRNMSSNRCRKGLLHGKVQSKMKLEGLIVYVKDRQSAIRAKLSRPTCLDWSTVTTVVTA